MLDKNNMPAAYLEDVKRHLQITWNDTDTTERLIGMMLDAEVELNHLFGAELDYFAPRACTQALPLILNVCIQQLPG